MMVTTAAWAVVMVLLPPWPCERIRQSNIYGHVTGRMLLWILGNAIKVEGMEHLKTRGIFICNHASPIDIFLVMWLAPTDHLVPAVRAALRAGQPPAHDRSNPAAAIESMKEVARAVVKNNLSLILFPEGTHLAWRNNSVRVRPVPLTVKILPPIRADDWEEERINEYVEMVRSLYDDNLPDTQKPLDALAARKSD